MASIETPLIMVHGAFCGGWCFDLFRQPFEAAGYRVATPDLPGHADKGESTTVAGRSMRDYARFVVELAAQRPEPPILLGHSMGGLVCELAATRIPVRALVLLAPSPPWGQPVSTVAEISAAFMLYNRGPYWLETISPDYPTMRAMSFDRLSENESRRLYERTVPESGRALFEIVNWWLDPCLATFVPPNGIGAPALALAGGRDKVHSPSTVEANAGRIGAKLQAFPQMSHWMIGEPGWEEVAETALDWLARV